MKNLLLILLIVALVATGYYFVSIQAEPDSGPVSVHAVEDKQVMPVKENRADELIQSPVSEDFNTESVPLVPPLDESNALIVASLSALSKAPEWLQWIQAEQQLRKFVVVVDNLAQGRLARKYIPIKAPAESYKVEIKAEKEYLLPASYSRYDNYINILSSLDTAQLVSTYHEFSPWLEQAFSELGYPPERNFEDTLMQAINHLLAIKNLPAGAHELTHTSVVYKFKDPELEKRSALDKQILRMGPENLKMLQTRLREFKMELNNFADTSVQNAEFEN